MTKPTRGAKIEHPCETCGQTMQVREADVKRGWGRFCSKSCKGRGKTKESPLVDLREGEGGMKMVRIKTAELVDRALDWAVAEAEGLKPYWYKGEFWVLDGIVNMPLPRFSENWAHGGPLFDAHVDSLEWFDGWKVAIGSGSGDGSGPTKLIALCRAIVAARLGDEVDVPAELVKEKTA